MSTKRANKLCQIYLATVQTTQLKDNYVSSAMFESFSNSHVIFKIYGQNAIF